jgi:hypothetical protein
MAVHKTRAWLTLAHRQIRTSGHVRSQTEITQLGAAPCGHLANQVSDRKAVLHAYLACGGHVA